jgi:Flp pilus assembly pilin Flp
MRLPEGSAEFVQTDDGAEVVEYAVMVALVVGGTILAIGALLTALLTQGQGLVQVIMGI